ncbi:Myb-like DNA-binding domain containing protein [Histomonas meleagridis]|uniref:Myb-like DNA-binding domain containing protein n=1 Tax=Histomonas meleagridis TaxID=135588 RepID=UPI0035593DEF|nr:Myb-like DNA-binding domain containing protein [Histomonas meleagridis]KAH0806855.1 Myb-like DNA-binding domain containing protein [Histomonas meleagridis]
MEKGEVPQIPAQSNPDPVQVPTAKSEGAQMLKQTVSSDSFNNVRLVPQTAPIKPVTEQQEEQYKTVPFVIIPDYFTPEQLDIKPKTPQVKPRPDPKELPKPPPKIEPTPDPKPVRILVNKDTSTQISTTTATTINTIFHDPTVIIKAFVANRQWKEEAAKKALPQKPSIPHRVVPSAPFPLLPKREQIQKIIDSYDKEITSLNNTIQSLEHQKQLKLFSVANMTDRDPTNNVQDYKGFIIPHNGVLSIRDASRSRALQASRTYILRDTATVYTHISGLRFLSETIKRHDPLLDPMLTTITHRRNLVRIKATNLAFEYVDRSRMNEKLCAILNTYSNEARQSVPVWPKEFERRVKKIPNPKGVAPDQFMYLDDMEKESYLLYDTNRFVSDPLQAHIQYKKRIAWAESEKQIFLEKYAQHPKDFKKIASCIHTKSVKDVVEYYGVNRIRLNLKQLETTGKRRGRKRTLMNQRADNVTAERNDFV